MLALFGYLWSLSLISKIGFLIAVSSLVGAGVLIYAFIIAPKLTIRRYTAQGIKTCFYEGLNPLEAWDKAAREHDDAFYKYKDFAYNNPDAPAFVTNLGPVVQLQLCDPKYIKEFYAKELDYYKKGWFIEAVGLILDGSLGFTNDTIWKARRRVFSKAFHFDYLQERLNIIENQAIKFCMKVHPSKVESFNAFKESKLLMANLVGELFFGKDLSNFQVEGEVIGQYVTDLFEEALAAFTSPVSMLMGLKLVRKGLLPAHRAIFRKKQILKQVCKSLIKEKEEELKDLPESYVPQNFLEIMIKARKTEPEAKIDESSMIDEFMGMFFAAVDTTSVLLSKSFYFVTAYPEMREKLLKEIDSTNWTLGQPLSIQTINKLEYLHAFIKETLRYSGVTFYVADRVATKDHQLLDIKIKKGDTVAVCHGAMSNNTKFYKNPRTFDPDRFLQKSDMTDPFTWVPFSQGKRVCLGQNLAMLEAKVIIIHFIKRYDTELPKGYKFQPHIKSINYVPLEPLILRPVPKTN